MNRASIGFAIALAAFACSSARPEPTAPAAAPDEARVSAPIPEERTDGGIGPEVAGEEDAGVAVIGTSTAPAATATGAATAGTAATPPKEGKGVLSVLVVDKGGTPLLATLLIDGKKLGTTYWRPYETPFNVAARTEPRRIEVRAHGFAPVEASVRIEPGKTATLLVTLSSSSSAELFWATRDAMRTHFEQECAETGAADCDWKARAYEAAARDYSRLKKCSSPKRSSNGDYWYNCKIPGESEPAMRALRPLAAGSFLLPDFGELLMATNEFETCHANSDYWTLVVLRWNGDAFLPVRKSFKGDDEVQVLATFPLPSGRELLYLCTEHSGMGVTYGLCYGYDVASRRRLTSILPYYGEYYTCHPDQCSEFSYCKPERVPDTLQTPAGNGAIRLEMVCGGGTWIEIDTKRYPPCKVIKNKEETRTGFELRLDGETLRYSVPLPEALVKKIRWWLRDI